MATGTSSRVSTPAFHNDDPEQTTEYRSLSVLAIISLIFGLASPLCFGAPLLMAIPIFGIAVSILALRRIAASEGALAGRWAAVAGLILCVALAVAPLSREFALRYLRTHQAADFAQHWLSLVVSGRTEQAFRLTIDSTRGPAPPAPGEKAPAPTNPYDTFMGLPLVKALAAAGADADIRFHGTVAYEPQTFPKVFVRQRYEIITSSLQFGAHPVDLLLTMQRAKLPTEGRARWLMWTMEDGSKPAAASAPPQ